MFIFDVIFFDTLSLFVLFGASMGKQQKELYQKEHKFNHVTVEAATAKTVKTTKI